MDLNGKIAIITGSSGKLGNAIALAAASAGCDCICHYHQNKPQAEQTATQIKALSRNAITAQADLSTEKGIDQLFAAAEKLGTAQILINSAAIFSRDPKIDVSLADIEKTLRINLASPMALSSRFANTILQKFGKDTGPVAKIVNIADVGGIRPWADYSGYCASKAGLIGMTKAHAKTFAPAISVNAIAPGMISWPDGFDEHEKSRQLNFVPAARFGTPHEIAAAVIFMLKNDYITGQVLNVDGGRCI